MEIKDFLKDALQDRIIDKADFEALEDYWNDVQAEVLEDIAERQERDMEAYYSDPTVIAGEVFQEKYDMYRKEY